MSQDKANVEEEPAATSFPHLAGALGRTWRLVKRAALIVLILAGGVILLEAVHLHQLLAAIHPLVAWCVSASLAAVVLGLLGFAAWRWSRIPRVVLPPNLPREPGEWTSSDRHAYLRFCRRYIDRQERNPGLPEESASRLPALRGAIDDAEATVSDPSELIRAVESAIDEALEPLDRLARNHVWRAASEVAVLTALTPSALFDVLITLLRNVELMVRIADLYYSRPGPLGTLRVVRDVMAVAATAGVVERVADGASDVAADMMGSLTAKLAGPIGQGVVNGLITVRLGDAAVLRCRALRTRRVGIKPWSPATWREMARRLSAMVSKRVAPSLAKRFGEVVDAAGGHQVRRGVGWVKRLFGSDAEPDPS